MRPHQPLSRLFIDLDEFKEINDFHGHLHGSWALLEVGAVIRRLRGRPTFSDIVTTVDWLLQAADNSK